MRLVLPLLAWRLFLGLLVIAAALALPPIFNLQAFNRNIHAGATPGLDTLFRTWDGEHYLSLAEHGYQPASQSNRFYPLWPLLIRAFSYLSGGSALAAALVLAAAFSTAAMVLLHDLVSRTRGAEVARTTVLLALAFPGALFFGFPYSESLFFFLLIATFWLLERDRPQAAAIPALLLSLTRAVGVLALLPIAWSLWQRRARGTAWLAAAAPLMGMGLYLLAMQLMVGDAFAGFTAQRVMVSSPSVGRIFDVAAFLRAWTLPVRIHGFFDSWIDRAAFLWTVATMVALARRDRTGLAIVLPMALIPATSTQLMSYTRYAAVLFPSFVVTAQWLEGESRAAWRAVVLGVLLSLQFLLLLRHANFIWAG